MEIQGPIAHQADWLVNIRRQSRRRGLDNVVQVTPTQREEDDARCVS